MGEPVMVDAVGEDGKSVLGDLQHASPTGGQVRWESVPHTTLLPGLLLRTNGGPAVILTVHHYGVQGYSEVEYLGTGVPVARRAYFSSESVEVRTDVLIAADSLYKLTMSPDHQRCQYCRSAAGPFDKINKAGNLACRNTKLCWIRRVLQHDAALVCDSCYRLVTGLLAECEDWCARSLNHGGLCLSAGRDRLSAGCDQLPCEGCATTGVRMHLLNPEDLTNADVDDDDEHFLARKLAAEMNAPIEIPGIDY